MALAGCDRVPHQAPPRATDAITVPPQISTIDVPISADLGQLARSLEDGVPRKLWSIDRPGQTCVASKQVKVLFVKLKTPTLKCRIVGTVTRGPISLSAAGKDIVVVMPIHAVVSAEDVGGILKRETANADARVRAVMWIEIAPDWSLRGKVLIDYDWTDAPHIDFLGRRIEFTSQADEKLKGVVADLERMLPRELAKLKLRDQVERAWASAFTSIELNHANPPVWMRITPHALTYSGYNGTGNTLTLKIGMKARTETFVGPRPADSKPSALPNFARTGRARSAILFTIPVIADYRELEPILAEALAKRSLRSFDIPGLGPVNAKFGRVTIYGTNGGKIAVGLTFTAAEVGGKTSSGTVWLTAKPANAVNDKRVAFTDLAVVGVTNSVRTGLLIKLANAPGLSATVADALTQNFGKDYDELLAKVTRAIEAKRIGDFLIRAHITDIRTGQLKVAGQGVYLPVWGRGTASILLDRRPSDSR